MAPELVGILIGIIGVIVAIVAAGISYHSIRVTRNIATSSGVLKIPELSLRYGLSPLSRENSNIQTVVYGVPEIKDGKYIGTFRIIIENTGKRVAENVKLEIIIPAGANHGAEVLEYKIAKGILPGALRECFRIGELLHIWYYFPLINPKETVSIEEHFWLLKTVDRRVSSVATTKDKKKVKYKIDYTVAFIFRLNLHHKNELPLTSEVHLYVMDASGINAIAERWVEMEIKKDGHFPSGSQEKQVRWLMKQMELKKFLLVIPAFEKLKGPKKKVAFVEDFDKSQRWLLVRSNQKWEARECKWKFR